MKTSVLLLVLRCAGFNAQAQTGLFIDYTQSGWNLSLTNVDPNTNYTFSMIQSAGSGTISFSLAVDGTYSSPLDITIATDGSGNGSTPFWVKGTALGPATWQVCQQGPTNCTGGATIPFSVVTISTLQYQAIDSPLDTNPNAGGGDRIYPDKTTPSDGTNRKRVRVKATLSAAVISVPIYFKSFDVDDPSSNASPVDPDAEGANSGDDNRAATNKPGILSPANQTGTTNTVTLTTNSSGVAEADLTVTMHPGDNFMAAASGDPSIVSGIQIDGITLKDAGNNTLPITRAKNTTMLTVWRKLHLEVDNMGAVTDNFATGTITSAVRVGNTTVLTVNSTLDVIQYENGRMTITGMSSYDVLSNTANTVTIDKKINTSQATGSVFTMVDDDDYDNDNNPNTGDVGEASVATVTALSKMQPSDSSSSNVFAPVYIMPVYDGGGNPANNGTAAFAVNVEAGNLVTQLDSHRASNGENDFWVSYVQFGYQYGVSLDFDPGTETMSFLGGTSGFTANSVSADCSGLAQGSTGSLIFQESIRDGYAVFGYTVDDLVTPHEVGHQFGLHHINNTIMGSQVNLTNFDSEHIHMIRCRVKSPGK